MRADLPEVRTAATCPMRMPVIPGGERRPPSLIAERTHLPRAEGFREAAPASLSGARAGLICRRERTDPSGQELIGGLT
jgi:hypothetical protein